MISLPAYLVTMFYGLAVFYAVWIVYRTVRHFADRTGPSRRKRRAQIKSLYQNAKRSDAATSDPFTAPHGA